MYSIHVNNRAVKVKTSGLCPSSLFDFTQAMPQKSMGLLTVESTAVIYTCAIRTAVQHSEHEKKQNFNLVVSKVSSGRGTKPFWHCSFIYLRLQANSTKYIEKPFGDNVGLEMAELGSS